MTTYQLIDFVDQVPTLVLVEGPTRAAYPHPSGAEIAVFRALNDDGEPVGAWTFNEDVARKQALQVDSHWYRVHFFLKHMDGTWVWDDEEDLSVHGRPCCWGDS